MAVAAGAQVPAGGEFRVNTFTTDHQGYAHIAANARGDSVAMWTDSGQNKVLGQRYDPSGAPRGGEFETKGHQVALDAAGNFIVVYVVRPPTQLPSLFGRRFGADGLPRGAQFQVNTYSSSSSLLHASLAGTPTGTFVVTWSTLGQDGSSFGIFARRYDGTGIPLGPEFQVNTFAYGSQYRSEVAMASDGRFIIVWDSFQQDGDSYGVYGQRFDAAGSPDGVEFRLNDHTTAHQIAPDVAMAGDGSFVATWSDVGLDGSDTGVVARLFDVAGAPRGPEFTVNTNTLGYQQSPRIAMDGAGRFVVAWYDDQRTDVVGQRFTADGARRGSEFRANTYTTGSQEFPSIASDAAGNFVMVWDSLGQDGSGRGVFGQRFGGLLPAALAVDAAGNGVLEAGESVDVQPSWRNAGTAAQAFAAAAIGFTGAPPATYLLLDATADYGTVGGGSTAQCTDCYRVSVPATTRPLQHWDAVLQERITPDAQGQDQQWSLHVGESFGDVPRASGFYRFVETLLHHGVTGGCGASTYCPGASATREQMAVFALVAKEGPDYVPPPCTTPIFTDVPSTSPFCRWIEEMARRGVVSGCGGGNYCPTAPVSREQMAVFVLRTVDPALTPPACTTPIYNDVPATSGFCRWIEELTRRSVVSGCGGGNYCPAASVTREQMGVFLSVTFGLTLYGP